MELFHHLFPAIAQAETREIILKPPGPSDPPDSIPAGRYRLVEHYCTDPGCDCRRVLISVLGQQQRRILATISHSFEPPHPGKYVQQQTYLDPLLAQSPWSERFLGLFVNVVLADPNYAARLVRHYTMVKEAIADPTHPIHRRPTAPPPPRSPRPSTLPPRRRGFRKKWR